MELAEGKIAVVTGAAGGIGLALAERFARAGLHVVLADVDEDGLARAATVIEAHGVETLIVPTDVSVEASVQALAAATMDRFGAVHVVCNNAGVATLADPWFGPLSAWEWVIGVNMWGVIHGVRAFLPHLAAGGEGHIVNTASIAGLMPGIGAHYDASKHAVVAMTEDLYTTLQQFGVPVGVSVLCPGWVRTGIMDSDRNWPDYLGDVPPEAFGSDIVGSHVRRAVDEGLTPGTVADLVADAIEGGRFWVFPHPDWIDMAELRWRTVAEGQNPTGMGNVPGLPPADQIAAEVLASVEGLALD
jgi:NAD(P)-dependent dehydrogenase (short-subunit alcohol dehydrogenase family)